jgi:hypothetical protein
MSEFLPILFWLLGGILLCPMLTMRLRTPISIFTLLTASPTWRVTAISCLQEDQATDPKNFLMIASHNANASQRSGRTTQSIKTGEWYPAIPPMFHPTENLSPADYFGRAMVDSLPGVTVGIIPVGNRCCSYQGLRQGSVQGLLQFC